jgi:hypothetical protein
LTVDRRQMHTVGGSLLAMAPWQSQVAALIQPFASKLPPTVSATGLFASM